jgi:uncharacterized protein YjbI with pentapeptide repeats
MYFSDVNFDACNFRDSDFSNAVLDSVSFKDSDFEGAIFTGAKLTNCKKVNEVNKSLQDAMKSSGAKCLS